MKTTKLKTQRSSPRRAIEPLQVSSVSLLENLSKLARTAQIIEASVSGFLLVIKREDLVPKELKQHLNIDVLVGSTVLIYLSQMNLELSGKVMRTRFLGKNGFEIGIDFREDAPEYWRECLLDLLPAPGEFEG